MHMNIMEMKQILHMNAGNGENSYANNSGLQKDVISNSRSILDETLKNMMLSDHNHGFPKSMKMVDLGCASGPNTLLAISHIMDTIQELCKDSKLPEFEMFLNDLPNNDFNNLFKLIPSFYENELNGKKCFIFGLPGSFYGRLFSAKTLHFAYCSNALHWLSQVPPGLENNNKENIYIGIGSSQKVYEKYLKQFQRDFFMFLSSRGEEMIPNGCMVLTIFGRRVKDSFSRNDCEFFTMFGEVLLDMVNEGLVEKADLHSFNLPIYAPCKQEVEAIIESEGSFNLNKLENFEVPWVANSNIDGNAYRSGEMFLNAIRAAYEPTLRSHFGNVANFDNIFARHKEKVAKYISTEKPSLFYLSISLSKK